MRPYIHYLPEEQGYAVALGGIVNESTQWDCFYSVAEHGHDWARQQALARVAYLIEHAAWSIYGNVNAVDWLRRCIV